MLSLQNIASQSFKLELFFDKKNKQMFPPFRVQNVSKYMYNYQSKGNNFKNKQSRVMVLIFNTSSYCALQMYEFSSKYL